MTRKISMESLAAVGITGGLAVALILGIIALVLALNLGIFALLGVLIAYVWNTFVVPSVDADLPTLLWWQASLILLALRVVTGVIMPNRSS